MARPGVCSGTLGHVSGVLVVEAIDWSVWGPSLLTGLITAAAAVGGIALTQRRTDKRESVARTHEQRVWTRAQRHSAHAAFLTEQRRVDQWWIKVNRLGGGDIEVPGPAWFHPLGARLNEVEIFASRDAAVAARRLFKATARLEEGTTGAMFDVDIRLKEYQRLVQQDLGIEETDLPSWGEEG